MSVLSRVQTRQKHARSLSAVRVADLTLYQNRYGGDTKTTTLHLSDRPILLPRAQRVEGFVEGASLPTTAYSKPTRYLVTAAGRVRLSAVNWTGGPNFGATFTPSQAGSFMLVEVPTFTYSAQYREVSLSLCAKSNGDDTMYWCGYWFDGIFDPTTAYVTIARRIQGVGHVVVAEMPVPGNFLKLPFTLSATARHYRDRVELNLYLDGVSVLAFIDTAANRLPPGRVGFDMWTDVGSTAALEISRAAMGEITAYLPLVQDWGQGSGDEMQVISPGSSPGTAQLTLSNQMKVPGDGADRESVDRFSDLIRQGLNTSGFDVGLGDLVIDWLPTDYHAVVGYDSLRAFEGPVETMLPTEGRMVVTAKSLLGSMVMNVPEIGVRCGAPIVNNYQSLGDGFEIAGTVYAATLLPTSSDPPVASNPPVAMYDMDRWTSTSEFVFFTLIDFFRFGDKAELFDNRIDAHYRNVEDFPGEWMWVKVICVRHQNPTDADYPGCTPAGPSPTFGRFVIFQDPPSLLALERYHAGVWGQRPPPVVDQVLWDIRNEDYLTTRVFHVGSRQFFGLILQPPVIAASSDPNAQTFTEIDVEYRWMKTSSTAGE